LVFRVVFPLEFPVVAVPNVSRAAWVAKDNGSLASRPLRTALFEGGVNWIDTDDVLLSTPSS
jgi:hypothetical protein